MRITLSSILAVFAMALASQFAQADDYSEARKIFMDAVDRMLYIWLISHILAFLGI